MAVVFCNNNIEKVMYSGYTIDKIYACGGELVYSGSTPPTPTENWKAKALSQDSVLGDLYGYKDCDSLSAITSAETSSWTAQIPDSQGRTTFTRKHINALWIGDCTVSIGIGAFSGATDLQYVPNSGANVKAIGSSAFTNSTSLSSYTFGCKVETIGQGAFSGCTSLQTLEFCYSNCNLKSIESGAFKDCTNLRTVRLPNTLQSIGYSVFANCSNLTRLYMTATTPPTLPTNSYTFSGVDPNFDIIVPQGSLNAYKTASGWSEYANIIYTT